MAEKSQHTWKSLAEFLDRRRHLLLTDSFVLLPLGGRFQVLPRKTTSQEVHEDVTKGLHVIPPTLLYTTTHLL